MKRMLAWTLAAATVAALNLSAAYAGPGCGGAKDARAAEGQKTCADAQASRPGLGEFPTMSWKVGAQSLSCPMAAKQAADESGAPIVFVVAGREFAEEQAARAALADAAEQYVRDFVTIGCVVDGKVVYCGDRGDSAAGAAKDAKCGGGTKGQKVAAKDGGGCCSAGKGEKVASQDGARSGGGCCSAAKGDKVASKGGDGCCGGAKGEKVASKGGDGCCSAGKGEKVAGRAECDPATCTRFVVLGREFTDYQAARAAREAALAEIRRVKMTCVVNGVEVEDVEQVCPKAKAAGQVEFVVGKDHLKCVDAARCALAKARYEAARAAGEKLARL